MALFISSLIHGGWVGTTAPSEAAGERETIQGGGTQKLKQERERRLRNKGGAAGNEKPKDPDSQKEKNGSFPKTERRAMKTSITSQWKNEGHSSRRCAPNSNLEKED